MGQPDQKCRDCIHILRKPWCGTTFVHCTKSRWDRLDRFGAEKWTIENTLLQNRPSIRRLAPDCPDFTPRKEVAP